MNTFYIEHKDYRGDELVKVVAFDIYDAAETYAEDYDSDGDYSCIGGDALDLVVIDEKGDRHELTVTATSIPQYNAFKSQVSK